MGGETVEAGVIDLTRVFSMVSCSISHLLAPRPVGLKLGTFSNIGHTVWPKVQSADSCIEPVVTD